MRRLHKHAIPFRSSFGDLIASVVLTPTRDAECDVTAPLLDMY